MGVRGNTFPPPFLVQPEVADMLRVGRDLALLHPLDDIGQRRIGRRGDPDILGLVADEAVEEFDLGPPPLHHVLAHGRPVRATAGRCSSYSWRAAASPSPARAITSGSMWWISSSV